MLFWKNCKECGAKNSRSDNFCINCGAPLPKSKAAGNCPGCNHELSAGDRFCPNCGKPLPTFDGAAGEISWALGDGEYARLISGVDMEPALGNGLVVEQNTEALLFLDGRLIDRLPPGRHDVESVGDYTRRLFGRGPVAKVVLVDAGIVPLRMMVNGLKTSDPLFVRLECEMVLRVQNPDVFHLNLFKNRASLDISEITALMSDEIRDALREGVGRMSAREISSELSVKNTLANQAERHLEQTLSLYGLSLVQFRTLSMSHPRYDALQEIYEDTVLAVWEAESRLANRKKLFEVEKAERLQDIYEATAKLEHEESKIDVYARLRKAMQAGDMDKIRDEEAFAAFMLEVDKDRLLRAEELDEFKRVFRENREDHDRSRRHLLAKLDIEEKVELRRLELMGEAGLEEDVLKSKLKMERLRLEHQLAVENEKRAAARSHDLEDHLAHLKRRKTSAQTGAEIADIELATRQAEADFKMAERERKSALGLKNLKEMMSLAAEKEDRDLERRLKEDAQDHRHELERINALSNASSEALIAMSGREQATVLADLKKTELLSSWSEEQILAAAAEKSPEVARAFQEKFKGLNTQQVTALYERMIADRDAAFDRSRDDQHRTRQDMKDITMEALRQSGGKSAGPTAVHQVINAGGAGRPGCANCGRVAELGVSFCPACGSKM